MNGRTIVVLDPTAIPRPVTVRLAGRPRTLASATVALVSNNKPNVAPFYDALEGALASTAGAQALRETKLAASAPLTRDRLDEIAATCVAAVVAICD